MKKIFILFVFLLSSSLMAASEQLILTVTSDGMEGTLQLKVINNDFDEAVGLALYQKEDPDYREEFNSSDLDKGLVVLAMKSHEVVRLQSDNFDSTRGGTITLDYLENGITGRRSQVQFEVLHDGQKWGILHKRASVKAMFMEAKKIIFGKVIGIEKIHMDISGL